METPPVTDLMPVLGFSAADLAANQGGQLGPQQAERLAYLQGRVLLIGGATFIGLAFVATLLLFVGEQNDNLILSVMGVLLITLNGVSVGLFGRSWMRLAADRRTPVQALSGPLERVIRPSGPVNNYILRVQGVDFSVPKETFRLFRHEAHYMLYHTQHTHLLLSAIPDEKN